MLGTDAGACAGSALTQRTGTAAPAFLQPVHLQPHLSVSYGRVGPEQELYNHRQLNETNACFDGKACFPIPLFAGTGRQRSNQSISHAITDAVTDAVTGTATQANQSRDNWKL